MSSRSHAMRPATERDLPAVWSAVRMAGTFTSREDVERFWSDAPWRVQVSEAGDAAILARWREHLPILSVKGLWCGLQQIPPVMRQLRDVAAAQGFEDLLSPLTPDDRIEPYVDAGMRVVHTGLGMRADRARDTGVQGVPGVSLRRAIPVDLDALLRLDEECFSDFWRYDATLMAGYLSSERGVVATVDDAVIGYTLSTIDRGEGMFGRLAVAHAFRRHGVGQALVADVLGFMHRSGARSVSLYTQRENHVSRALYERCGFHVVGMPQHFLAFGGIVTR
ncbi:MAG: GNAT family N-acetyltransferase [Coriobacteriia bacterium]